jgi:predicted  nucleic acid-binding Zn-ribbon protein
MVEKNQNMIIALQSENNNLKESLGNLNSSQFSKTHERINKLEMEITNKDRVIENLQKEISNTHNL